MAVECCYQNIGIATSLALTMFEGDDLHNAMGVPFFYGVCEAFMVGIYCAACWKAGWSKAPCDAPLWDVISTSYEVVSAHHEEFQEIDANSEKSTKPTIEGLPYIEMGEVDKSGPAV